MMTEEDPWLAGIGARQTRFPAEALAVPQPVSLPAGVDDEFRVDVFTHTSRLLRSGDEKLLRATLSNNLNVILAALDAAARPPILEAQGVEHVRRALESICEVSRNCIKSAGHRTVLDLAQFALSQLVAQPASDAAPTPTIAPSGMTTSSHCTLANSGYVLPAEPVEAQGDETIVPTECNGQLCYYHGCQRLPNCALTPQAEKGA